MIDAATYGPWAVIAGGSEGVGPEYAVELARAGINSVLIARKAGALEATAERARSLGVEVRTVGVDLLSPSALDTIRETTDALDVGLLIYNAGSNTYRSEFVESDPAGVQGVIDLNITAPLLLSRHFGRLLKARGRGGLLFTGSNAGFVGHANIGSYAAAKAFLRVFVEGLWLELAPFGVDVLELSLGLTRTPAMERLRMRFDVAGQLAADPGDVAREGLAHLTHGPSWIASGHFEAVKARAGFPRAGIVLENSGQYRAIAAAPAEPAAEPPVEPVATPPAALIATRQAACPGHSGRWPSSASACICST